MAETIRTPDDRAHTLLGSTTLESIVREYAGDEAADRLHNLIEAIPPPYVGREDR